jgi:hypothetical protein
MYNLTCKEVSWLFYSGQGGGQTVGRRQDRRRNEEQMSTRGATQRRDLPAGGQESKNHKDRPNHHHKCKLSILIMTNNSGPAAFDGHLMENKGRKQKLVASPPTANPTRML